MGMWEKSALHRKDILKRVSHNACFLLRADLLELIEKIKDERKTGLQERNGRGKMMDTILASGLKIIYLFEESAEMKVTSRKKDKTIAEKTGSLKEIEEDRKTLEKENQLLTQEIEKLEKCLSKVTQKNQENDQKLVKLTEKVKNSKEKGKVLEIERIEVAKKSKELERILRVSNMDIHRTMKKVSL